MRIIVECFAGIDDEAPARTFEGEEFVAVSDAPDVHRLVINPNHADPKQQTQLHVKDGERSSTDPLRFVRVEVYDTESGKFLGGYTSAQPSFDITQAAVKTDAPDDANSLNTRPVDDSIAPLTDDTPHDIDPVLGDANVQR